MQVAPCIPVGIQLERAKVGPTSGPARRLASHLLRQEGRGPAPLEGAVRRDQQRARRLLRPELGHCAIRGGQPPGRAGERPPRPYERTVQNRFTAETADGAPTPRAGPGRCRRGRTPPQRTSWRPAAPRSRRARPARSRTPRPSAPGSSRQGLVLTIAMALFVTTIDSNSNSLVNDATEKALLARKPAL